MPLHARPQAAAKETTQLSFNIPVGKNMKQSIDCMVGMVQKMISAGRKQNQQQRAQQSNSAAHIMTCMRISVQGPHQRSLNSLMVKTAVYVVELTTESLHEIFELSDLGIRSASSRVFKSSVNDRHTQFMMH